MKFMKWAKDGGPESTVKGFFFIEIKSLFSIALLKFEGKSRNAFHTHAFHCISWLLSGMLREQFIGDENRTRWHLPSILPFLTLRSHFHKVDSFNNSWVFTIRGPWVDRWYEFLSEENRMIELRSGRIEV